MSDNFYMNNYNYDNLRYSQFYPNEKINSKIQQNINPFSKDINLQKVHSEPISNIPINYSLNQNIRNTISAFPFPRDSILENDNSNGQNGFIPIENKIKNVIKINPKNRNTIYNQNKNYLDLNMKNEVVSENLAKIKKSPMDDLSGNSSNNKNILSKSQNDMENNNKKKLKKKIHQKTSDNSLNNLMNNSINKNIKNKSIKNNINNNFKFNNNQRKKNIINNKNNFNNGNPRQLISNVNLKNKFINRNLAISSMLEKINFFQNLTKISQNRMQLFEKEYQNDKYFKKREFFDSDFINNFEMGKTFPLGLIFHYILNPKTEIKQFSLKKNFFESVLLLHGYKNIKFKYNYNDLLQVPKFLYDLNYANNLFNNFDKNQLNNFINEIKNWTKAFNFEVSYEDVNTNNNVNDQIKVYFISPNDITVEYNSFTSNNSKSFAEFNFHCDIDYDINYGRFTFKTNANVYNKCDELYQYEFLGEIWERIMIVINEESKNNKIIIDKLFKEHLKKNLNKYSPNDSIINGENEISGMKNNEINNENMKSEKELKDINNNKPTNNDDKDNKKINIKENEKEKNKDLINEQENKKSDKIKDNKEKAKEQILFYGVLLSFFLFIFKTVLNIELGSFSLETFFNCLIIIIIGFMLFKNQVTPKA